MFGFNHFCDATRYPQWKDFWAQTENRYKNSSNNTKIEPLTKDQTTGTFTQS